MREGFEGFLRLEEALVDGAKITGGEGSAQLFIGTIENFTGACFEGGSREQRKMEGEGEG